MPKGDTAKDLLVGIAASVSAAGLIALATVVLGDADARFATIAGLFVAAVVALALLATMSPRWVGGRERFMSRNCKAMNREVARVAKGEPGLIETTRFARWHLDERSTARGQLRDCMDAAARSGVRFRRIHNLISEDDRSKLLYEISSYEGCEKTSVGVVFDIDPHLIPELVITSDHAAIAPATLAEGVMGAGFVVRRRRHVSVLQEYFGTIWDVAATALEHGRPNPAVLDEIRTWAPKVGSSTA